jgi:putative FmdB family regulatory protein
MPIYEYRCAACGFQKEYLQKMSDALLTDCPECGKASLGKMVTAAGFQLKGSGWYATDFKQGAKPQTGGKAGAKTDATSEGKSDAKTESKAEAKADAGTGGGKPASDAPVKKTESSSTGSASTGTAASPTTTSNN